MGRFRDDKDSILARVLAHSIEVSVQDDSGTQPAAPLTPKSA
jgi:hypothetical protein